jgi:hypothetical protein
MFKLTAKNMSIDHKDILDFGKLFVNQSFINTFETMVRKLETEKDPAGLRDQTRILLEQIKKIQESKSEG